MRGKSKPTVLKDLHGSTEPRNQHEPKPEGALSEKPSECPVAFNDAQREIWETALRQSPPGMLKNLDASVLERWVLSTWMHRQAVAELQAGGNQLIITSPSGYPVLNPLVGVINRQALIGVKLASELGFSPVSRPRINVNGPSAGEDLSAVPPKRPLDAPAQSIEAYLAADPRFVN